MIAHECHFGATTDSAPAETSDTAAARIATDTALAAPGPTSPAKDIPAAAFAALVGRSLETLRAWDKAGLTHPEMRRSRRFYNAADLAAVLANCTGRKGAREGSLIKYIDFDWDNET